MKDGATDWFPAADAGEEGQVVGRFRAGETLDIAASKAADDYRYKPATYLDVRVQGSWDISAQRLKPHTLDKARARFPEAWREFTGEKVEIDGTPLSALGIEEEQETVFGIAGCRTVEQLAAWEDVQCENFGFGTRRLRDEAIAHLEKSDEPPVSDNASPKGNRRVRRSDKSGRQRRPDRSAAASTGGQSSAPPGA